jgi:hypothetical protein
VGALALFGKLIETGKETNVFWGYILGASLMIAAGIVQAVLGIEAARRDLEDIAKPLSAEAAEGDEGLVRKPLGERVNCRLWGPGRFRHALATAMARGAIRRSGRGRFVIEEDALAGSR